jgi:putative membrane protein
MLRYLPFCADRRLRRSLPLLLTGALTLALNASPVRAQAPAADAPTTAPAAPAAPATPATPSVSNDDRDIMQDLAHALHAELESARLALEKSKTERVLQFAQQMIDDNGQAQTDLQQLAQLKGVKLPQEANLAHKTLTTAMRLLTAAAFDRQYMTRISINDNERTVELLQNAQKNAKDTELRALLERQLAMAETHLMVARKLNGQKSS